MSVCSKSINVVIFSDKINVISDKRYMLVVLLIELYLFTRYNFQWLWLYLKDSFLSVKFKFIAYLVKTMYGSWFHQVDRLYPTIFDFHTFKGDNWYISSFDKNVVVLFFSFSDTVKLRSFKLCMIVTLLRVYSFIVGLMTLTCFKVTGVSEV